MTPPPLRRRDLLKGVVALVAGYGALKAGVRLLRGPAPAYIERDPARLEVLSPALEAVVTAAALAFNGAPGDAAYHDQGWDPALDVDRLMRNLAPDQVTLLAVGMRLFEEWTPGLTGFSGMPLQAQVEKLAAWRTGPLALQRSVWGFLHAACCSSFAGHAAGWALVGYPGPCVPGPDGPGRMPGQSARFTWDEIVP